jgi:magnesium transporter
LANSCFQGDFKGFFFPERRSQMHNLDKYLQENDQSELHPAEIANLLRELGESDFQKSISKIPNEIIGDVALELPDRYFGDVVELLNVEELSTAVKELESDDQTDFMQELEEVDRNTADAVFNALDADDQAEILQLKQYGENEAGAYMQMEVYAANINENVHDVIRRFTELREQNQLENVQYLFIVDDEGYLRYGVGLDSLLIFDFKKTIRENIEMRKENFVPVTAYDTEDIRDVVKRFEEYDLGVMPVVDSEGKLIGRITSDDIYDIINEHATEQMYRMAGVDDDAEEDEGIFNAGKKRAIWLSLNLVTAIIASLVIGLFEETLQNIVALAILMPIVASMGGNAGTQSLTVVVRQMALGEIAQKDAMRTIRKEVMISMGNGMLFAVIMGTVASVWFDKGMLGVVIALSMVINLLAAGFFGATVPLILKKFDIDPAIGSTVILTTVTDVVGFFSFLGLATAILL